MKVKVTSDQELVDLACELLHVMQNMRYWQNRWHNEHGSILLRQKIRWEARADQLLGELNMEKTHKANSIKIEINDTKNTTT